MLKHLIGFLALTGATASAEPLIARAMLKPDPQGMQGEEVCRGEAEFAGIKLPFEVHVTAKGNGALTMANLNLHVYDDHDDGQIYDGFLLNVEVANLGASNGDCLVISGTAIHTGEKGTEHVPECVVFIYRFDRDTKQFSRVYKHASFDLEL